MALSEAPRPLRKIFLHRKSIVRLVVNDLVYQNGLLMNDLPPLPKEVVTTSAKPQDVQSLPVLRGSNEPELMFP